MEVVTMEGFCFGRLALGPLVRAYIGEQSARGASPVASAACLKAQGIRIIHGRTMRARAPIGGDIVVERQYLPAGLHTWSRA